MPDLKCPFCAQKVSGQDAANGECSSCELDVGMVIRKPSCKSGARGSKKKRGQVGKGVSRSGRKRASKPVRKKSGHSITVYTDGSSRHNGKGGWAWAYQDKDGDIISDKGREYRTTNNRMELLAIVRALEHFSQPSNLIIVSDSQYCIKGAQKWMYKWESNGWNRTVTGEQVKNESLWRRVLELTRMHKNVSYIWIKGHSGYQMNELCDRLASGESELDVNQEEECGRENSEQ